MKRSKKKITVWSGVLTVLALAAVLALKGGGKEVETVAVQQGDITRSVVDTGNVQPTRDYNLYATQSARVVQVPVDTGQSVKKGQTLVVLENLDLSLQISDVRSQISQTVTAASGARAGLGRTELELKDAKENLARVQQLMEAGVATRVEYDKARLQAETLQQSLNEQQARLESALAQESGLQQSLRQLVAKERQLVMNSPVDGVVLSLPVKQEQVLNPGALMAAVASSDQLEIKADILSDDLAEVEEGQKVTVTAPVLGSKGLAGVVKQIYPRAEEKQSALGIIQRRVPVIITLTDLGNLKPGYEVTVAIETISRQNVLTVPREAVRTTGAGKKEVMVVVDKRIQHRQVETGISDKENIEITAGLQAGDLIIKDGGLNLAEKLKVKAVDMAQSVK